MTFLPDLAVMLAYTAAAIILVITPGRSSSRRAIRTPAPS